MKAGHYLLVKFQINVLLTGTLLRKLEAGLRGVSHVIVDEIHERDINVSTPTFLHPLLL